ncbi:MAG: hypothetical protein PUA75_05760 [Clostridiales bacterium]|nr:hypothetical protein [Clostridiales bacterium]
MEINEKLDIFFEAAIAAANKQSEEILEEQKHTYQQAMEEYEKSKKAGWQARERALEAKLKKEANRRLSEQATLQKRTYYGVVEQKTEELFTLVEEKIKAYRNTDEYEALLVHYIEKAKAFAKGESITIYLTPSDAEKKERLEQKTGMVLTIGEEEFIGGIRAVIASKNVLIDESFGSRLKQERENYSF